MTRLQSIRRSTVGTGVLCAVLIACGVQTAGAQIAEPTETVTASRSPVKAAALSLLLPGLGQRYADGSWRTTSSLVATADVGLWLGLIQTLRTRSSRIDSYRALAVSGAQADVEGKNRRFFLNLATYRSSDEYLEVQLRNRAWDQLDYVSDPSFQWSWAEEEDFLAFRDLRESSETLGRRRSVLIAALVANRAISALVALRKAGRANRDPARVAVGPPPVGESWPTLHVTVGL